MFPTSAHPPMTTPPPPGSHRIATALARLIALWHRTRGLETLRERGFSERGEYHEVLAWLRDADLEDAATQHHLAKLQVSGALEWAYSQPVPPELWHEFAPPDLQRDAPPSLGAAGHWLLEVSEHRHRETERSDAERQEGERIRLHVRDREDLVRQARAAFPDMAADEENGLGGMSFLISSSLERNRNVRRGEGLEGNVTLLGPGALGVVRVQPSNTTDVVNLVRSGELEVESATGYTVRWALQPPGRDDRRDEARHEEDPGF